MLLANICSSNYESLKIICSDNSVENYFIECLEIDDFKLIELSLMALGNLISDDNYLFLIKTPIAKILDKAIEYV